MPCLVVIGPVVMEKKIFLICQLFSQFCNYLHLEKGVALHLNKLESPSHKDDLCQVWLKLAHWFWRRRSKCEKFTTMKTKTTTMTTTDNGQIFIRKAHLSLRFRWAKNAPFIITCLTTLSLEIAIVHTHQICSSDIHKKFSFIHAVLW